MFLKSVGLVECCRRCSAKLIGGPKNITKHGGICGVKECFGGGGKYLNYIETAAELVLHCPTQGKNSEGEDGAEQSSELYYTICRSGAAAELYRQSYIY